MLLNKKCMWLRHVPNFSYAESVKCVLRKNLGSPNGENLSCYLIGFLYSQMSIMGRQESIGTPNWYGLQEFLADGVFLRPSDGRAYLHLKARESIGRVDVLDCNNVQAWRSVSSIPQHAIVSRKLLFQPVACSCDIHFASLVTYLNLVNHLYTKLWSFHPHHWTHFSKVTKVVSLEKVCAWVSQLCEITGFQTSSLRNASRCFHTACRLTPNQDGSGWICERARSDFSKLAVEHLGFVLGCIIPREDFPMGGACGALAKLPFFVEKPGMCFFLKPDAPSGN